jgi:glycosyltransferase involved in cell wall biosynthesis
MRVDFVNNYSMTRARELWRAGIYPGQHLWGADVLEAYGADVRYVPFASRPALVSASRRARFVIGDLSQQRELWSTRHEPGVCYAADQTSLKGLAMLRRLRLWSRPVAAVVHHPIRPGGSSGVAIRGVDRAVCLSSRVQEELVARFGRSASATPVLPWGPDLSYAGYRATGDDLVVSCGKSNRDIETLLAALHRVGTPAAVYSLEGHTADPDSGVQMVSNPTQFEFAEVINHLQRASIVAIPVRDTERLSGLTELNDALALGKPIVMTRTPYIDVDLESVGCGIWVGKGDVDGWARALRELGADADRRREMGDLGRKYAETRWNAQLFGEGLVRVLEELAGSDLSGRPDVPM